MEVDRLQQKGAIVPVKSSKDQFLSSFFLIDKSSGGKRFILNLRDLNSHVEPPHFKLEDWRTVVRLMLPGTYMATLDLEDAYLLVPIFEGIESFFASNGAITPLSSRPCLSACPRLPTYSRKFLDQYLPISVGGVFNQ